MVRHYKVTFLIPLLEQQMHPNTTGTIDPAAVGGAGGSIWFCIRATLNRPTPQRWNGTQFVNTPELANPGNVTLTPQGVVAAGYTGEAYQLIGVGLGVNNADPADVRFV